MREPPAPHHKLYENENGRARFFDDGSTLDHPLSNSRSCTKHDHKEPRTRIFPPLPQSPIVIAIKFCLSCNSIINKAVSTSRFCLLSGSSLLHCLKSSLVWTAVGHHTRCFRGSNLRHPHLSRTILSQCFSIAQLAAEPKPDLLCHPVQAEF